MEACLNAEYIDEFIMFCAAVWMTGVGFGYIRLADELKSEKQQWWTHVIGHFKWMGPLLAGIAIFLVFAA
jgi:hypothetical protein